MKRKKIFVFGAGRRVVNDILPVIESLSDQIEIVGICNTRKKCIFGKKGHVYRTILLNESKGGLLSSDLVYLGVPTSQVSNIITYIKANADYKKLNLILDTPVTISDAEVQGFQSVSVAEDILYLPWLNLLDTNTVKGIRIDRGMQRYHGVAFLKKVFNSKVVCAVGIFRTSFIIFKNARWAIFHHPRDYALGRIDFVYKNNQTVSTDEIEAVLDKDKIISGFKFKEKTVGLSGSQKKVCCCINENNKVVANMLLVKRMALVTVFEKLLSGTVPYLHEEGLNDHLVDQIIHGKKTGFYLDLKK